MPLLRSTRLQIARNHDFAQTVADYRHLDDASGYLLVSSRYTPYGTLNPAGLVFSAELQS